MVRDRLDALGHGSAHELAHGDALGIRGTLHAITEAARGARPDLIRVAAGVLDEGALHGSRACDLTRKQQSASICYVKLGEVAEFVSFCGLCEGASSAEERTARYSALPASAFSQSSRWLKPAQAGLFTSQS